VAVPSDIASTDPVTYVAVVAMPGMAVFLASYPRARCATRMDPLVSFRAE
jgi:hypothetical protein